MFVAGIDLGRQTTKAVVMSDGKIAGHAVVKTSDTIEADSRQALATACHEAGIAQEDVSFTVATGALRKQVTWPQMQRTADSCLAKGSRFLFPNVKTVFDVGAEGFTVVKVGDGGSMEDSAGNDRCASGAGVFLETMTKHVLHITPAEMTRLGIEAEEAAEISSTCAIFAEQEVISHIHRVPATPLPHVVAGIYRSIITRVVGVGKRLLIQPDIVITGGLGKDAAFVHVLEKVIGRKAQVPEFPQIVSAIGAALVAQEKVQAAGR